MRAKTILTLLFLASISVFAILYVSSLPSAVDKHKNEVLAASARLSSGTLLRAQDVVWQQATSIPGPDEIIRPSTARPDASGNSKPRPMNWLALRYLVPQPVSASSGETRSVSTI
jgi:hypothetical protein